MEEFIKLSNVYFSYGRQSQEYVLKNISFDIKKGEKLAIVGANGSGKSTLSKMLNAILIPSRGVIFVNGIDSSRKETVLDIRQNVGLIFQDPDNQIVATIVEEDVAFALENLCVSQEEIGKKVDLVLSLVEMVEFRKRSVENLSGGQKSKVSIAGILAMNPNCIIFDESTAMLDPKSRQDILKIMKELNEEKGTTVVNITHNMREVAFFDRVIVLKDGEILRQDTPKNIFSDLELLKTAKLSLPQISELISVLNKEGIVEEKVALSVDECVSILANLLKGGKI